MNEFSKITDMIFVKRIEILKDIFDELVEEYGIRLSSYCEDKIILKDNDLIITGLHKDCGSYDNPYDERYEKTIKISDKKMTILKGLYFLINE